MVRVLVGSLVTVIGLSACRAPQVEIPPSVDVLAQDCYRLVSKAHPDHHPDLQSPADLGDGTVLIQWRVSEVSYGSCQADSGGNVLMMTQAAAPVATPAPETPTAEPVSQPGP
ncbi:MAG: hypothetical protein AAFZ80_01295 [Cyanobacteria bacterium P01_A01_bin.105]